jgi:hypothetical protein
MPPVRGVDELSAVHDPAWPEIAAAIDASPSQVRRLPIERAVAERCLWRLQVTAHSVLGALALETGGLVIDDGWLRVLGGGSGSLIDLATANELGDPTPESVPRPLLVVALDVVGGRFAINGGGLKGELGEVNYWGPDTLDWQSIHMGHGQFVHWALGPGLSAFYADLRWPDWADEVRGVGLDEALTFYPPLCTREGSNPDNCKRAAVPRTELDEVLTRLAALPNGQRFEFEFE